MKNNLVNSSRLFKKIYSESPGGVLAIRRPYNFVKNRYPIFFEEAKGSKVTDIDKNTYLDMMCGYGPIVIGHRNNFVDNRVIKHIKNKGNCLTLTQPTQYKLIKKLNLNHEDFKIEIENNQKKYEQLIDEAADQISNFVKKAKIDNLSQ